MAELDSWRSSPATRTTLIETRFDVGLVARENNHVALREIGVGVSSVAIVISILSIIGIAVLVGVAKANEG